MTSPTLVQHGLERHARASGGRTCLLEGDEALSYAEVDDLAERFARALRERGIAPGDRVALLLGSSRRYVAALHGTLKADAVAVPLNPAWRAEEWEEAVSRCTPGLLVTEERLAATVADSPLPHRLACIALGAGTTLPGLDLAGVSPDPRPAYRNAEDPAVLLFTSGSTGAPKGVVLTHRNVVANTLGVLEYLRLGPEDRGLAVLPFQYVYGLSVLETHLWSGASLAIESRTAYPQVILREMARLGITGLSGVPSTFMVLLQKGDFEEIGALPRLRYLTCAGGHLPDVYVQRLAERFPGVELFLMYGATEAAGRISYLPPDRIERKRGSIGVPIRGVEMRVQVGGRPAAPGEEGEIEACGETFSPGYWPLVEPEDRLPEDGWYRTGDLGYQDADGFFFLTGRASDLIKIAGHRVSGAEIERALYDTGLVEECAVLGQPDEALGERAEAWVVPARPGPPGITAEEILARVAERLPAYKRPSRIHLQDALAKSANGKILKSALRPPLTVCMAMLTTSGGSSTLAIALGRELADRGFGVRYCHCDPQADPLAGAVVLTADEALHTSRLLDTDRSLVGGIDACSQLLAAWDAAPFDLLHLHSLQAFGLPAWFLSRLRGVPYVVTMHGSDVLDEHLMDRKRDLVEELLRGAAAVTCVSGHLAEVLHRKIPGLSHVHVVHNFLRRGFVLAGSGAPRQPSTFLHVSSLRAVKRPELLLAAFALVRERLPGALLRIVTTGRGLTRAAELLRDYPYPEAVTILDGGNDPTLLSKEYHEATAFVLTSRFESFGLVILEAMAHGLPVVAPAVGGIPEVLGESWPFLVRGDTADPRGYAEAMAAIPGRDLESDCLAVAARFAPGPQVERYVEVYRSRKMS